MRKPDTSPPTKSPQYLSVKNWARFQPKLKNGKDRRDWIRLDTNLEDDPEFLALTCFQRYLLLGVWRLKGRTGKNPPNDPAYIARALQIEPKQRHNTAGAVHKLVLSGFLTLSNQQIDGESALQDKTLQRLSPPNPLREGEAHGQKPPDAPGSVSPSSECQTRRTTSDGPPRGVWPDDMIEVAKIHNLDPPLPPEDEIPRAFIELWDAASADPGQSEAEKPSAYNYWADINPGLSLQKRMVKELRRETRLRPWETDDYWCLSKWLFFTFHPGNPTPAIPPESRRPEDTPQAIQTQTREKEQPCRQRKRDPNHWYSRRSNRSSARSRTRLEARN